MKLCRRVVAGIVCSLLPLAPGGCGDGGSRTSAESGEADKSGSADAGKTGSASPEKTTAEAEAPDTASPLVPALWLADYSKVIDLRTFPTPEAKKVQEKTVSKASFELANDDMHQAIDFYREALQAAGWKVRKAEFYPEHAYATVGAFKQGCRLGVNVVRDPISKQMMAYVTHEGNIDCRSLPRHPGSKLTQNVASTSIHNVQAPLADVGKFVVEELTKLGWRRVAPPGGRELGEKGKDQYLRFLQGAIELGAILHFKDGATEVMYNVHIMRQEAPILPDVAGAVEFIESPLMLDYRTAKSPDEVVAYCDRAFSATGWKKNPATKKADDGLITVLWEQANVKPLTLDMLVVGKFTVVRLRQEFEAP